ncbi:unnamed protein product [Echinostoma caproni]|uniref:UBA_e1_C domain-containing protein n=1 Tax=Echinostoma caproni TaxID=27848 RepID=A0A183B4D0_9TREM|nr:unnamed protein product [Echinostoma caproni]
MTSGDLDALDEGLYSRQLYVVGVEGMKQLTTSNVFIYGVDGLGLEIAKDIVLAGVRSVTLYDPEPITWADLSTHFYAGPENVGHSRAEVSRGKLAALNSHVVVNVLIQSGEPKPVPDFVRQFTVIVLVQAPHTMCLQWGEVCHRSKVKLVIANTAGLFGRLFCDCGENYLVTDPDGEESISVLVEHIEKSPRGLVKHVQSPDRLFSDSCYVTFHGIVGMTELNECAPRKITVQSPTSFEIGDTSGLSDYISGGVCTQVKIPQKYTHLAYGKAFLQPHGEQFDFIRQSYAEQLHLCFASLNQHQLSPWNRVQARRFVDLVKQMNETELKGSLAYLSEVDENLCRLFAMISTGQCSPVQDNSIHLDGFTLIKTVFFQAVIGAFAAQQVMNMCSGKFTPLNQWYYLDASNCLPPAHELDAIGEEETKACNTRYDGQIAIFGRQFQNRLSELKYFIVGAGALGCELLKNIAMMGVGASKLGKITVTDMDSIERSNLNRQFLFRPNDIGHMKSVVAAKAINKMNPEINIDSHQNRVSEDTENIYHEQFFESLDGVLSAVDGIPPRQYIDHRCVQHGKPWIDSGTMGAMGSTLVVLPHLTRSYSSVTPLEDQPERYGDYVSVSFLKELIASIFTV